jgi:enoyl-CoA hydratase/carnithine racemase
VAWNGCTWRTSTSSGPAVTLPVSSATVETLQVTRADGVVTVTLDRPARRNAIDSVMWGELLAVFTEVAGSSEDRVLVITGAGGAFCSGADLSAEGESDRHQLDAMRRIGDVALRLHRVAKPTIAKVGGVAAGAGCNLALGCDLIVASDEARFSEIFARRGLSLDFGGSWLLPRLVGLHKAKELAFFADVISAKEALDIGIVNRVVPAGELDAVVDDWARRLAAGPPLALSMTKTMLNNAFAVAMDQALEDESRCQTVNFGTADTAEAMAAFLQKREPRFTGK